MEVYCNTKYVHGKVHKANIILMFAPSHEPRLASRICLITYICFPLKIGYSDFYDNLFYNLTSLNFKQNHTFFL